MYVKNNIKYNVLENINIQIYVHTKEQLLKKTVNVISFNGLKYCKHSGTKITFHERSIL